MAIELDHTSVVVVGAWNPAIIQPNWLIRQKLVDADKADEMGFQPIGRVFIFRIASIDWKVEETRLEVRSKVRQDCGACVARILNLLPHTPVQAIGTNFVFTCKLAEWPTDRLPRLDGLALPKDREGTDFRQASWKLVREFAKTLFGVEVRQDFETMVVSFNFHRNCGSASEAAEFAGDFLKDRDLATNALRDMFRINFSWRN